jgi:small subunit ribosomal protein S15
LPPEIKEKTNFEMYLTTEIKQDLFAKHGFDKKKQDTGSAESQVALFTHRINHLTQHLKANKKDFSTQQGLMKLVGKRKKLLNYLQNTDIERYRAILADLDLRK